MSSYIIFRDNRTKQMNALEQGNSGLAFLLALLRKTIASRQLVMLFPILLLIFMHDAAAFECRDWSVPSRFVICSDPELIRLADARQKTFDDALARLDAQQRQELLADQRAWENSYPSACGVAPNQPPPNPVPKTVSACFKRAADARLAYIRAYAPGGAMADVAPSPTPPEPAVNIQGRPERIGPSFDCEKAVQPIGQMICADPTLSRLDLEFVQAYQALRYQVGETGQGQLRQEALEFHNAVLRECGVPDAGPIAGSTDCVRGAYKQQRLKWLSRLSGPALEEARRPIERHFHMQLTLRSLGLINTQPDGVYGSDTRSAIIAFQRSHGLTITGFLSDIDASVINRDVTAMREVTARNEASPKQSATPPQDNVPREPRVGTNTSGPQTQAAPDQAIRPSPPVAQNSVQQDKPDPPRAQTQIGPSAQPIDCVGWLNETERHQWPMRDWPMSEIVFGKPMSSYTEAEVDSLISSAQRFCPDNAIRPFLRDMKRQAANLPALRKLTEPGPYGVSCAALQNVNRCGGKTYIFTTMEQKYVFARSLTPDQLNTAIEFVRHCPPPMGAHCDPMPFINDYIKEYLSALRDKKVFSTTQTPTCSVLQKGQFVPNEKTPITSLPMNYFQKLVEVAKSCDNETILQRAAVYLLTREAAEVREKTGLADAADIFDKAKDNLAAAELSHKTNKFFFVGNIQKISKISSGNQYVFLIKTVAYVDRDTTGTVECHIDSADTKSIERWSATKQGQFILGEGTLVEIQTVRTRNNLGLVEEVPTLRANNCAM